MKYFPLLLALILFSCKEKKQPTVEVPPPPQTPTIISCDFGIDSTGFEVNRQSASRRPIKNTKPPVIVPIENTSAVILLDFDGHTVANTSWNYNGNIVCEGSGLDSAQMVEVINKFVEAYAPWQVSITTSEAVFNAAASKIRLILTRSYEWYGQSGGVSFVGSFKFTDGSPAFVFTSLLGYNIKYIKEAAVHEVGHSLGLYHQSTYLDGVKTSEYNFGSGGVAPIAGCAYYQPISEWIVGKNSNGTMQDDKAIIGTYLKLK